MKYKILVLDIDGTVNNSAKEVTPRTREAIIQLQKKGVKVVVASGRPTYGIMPVARVLHMEGMGGYVLSYNGGKIMNCSTKKVIYEKTLPHGFLGKIEAMARKHQCEMMSYEGNCVITTCPLDPFIDMEAKINHLPIRPIRRFSDFDEYNVNKCIVTAEGDDLEQAEPFFVKEFPELNIFRSEPYFLEIVPKGIDKAQSLAVLLEQLGIRREEMVACGDGYNDITMLQYAGMGVAMANAQEAVKKSANFVTKSNDEDGVAYAIEKFWT